MSEVDELKKKIADYERRMGIGQDDPAKDGYLVLVKILRQQNAYLKEINVKDMITKEDKTKSTAEYERAKGLWENLPKMIQSVSDLRVSLKMVVEDESKQNEKPISATSIAEEEEDDD